MPGQAKFGALKLRALLSCSVLALAAAPHIAQAGCSPNPPQDNTTTTCTGTESNGLTISSNNSVINVNAGASVLSPGAGTAAVAVAGSSNSTMSVNGTIDGGTEAGVLVSNAQTTQSFGVTVGAGGVIQGGNGIVVNGGSVAVTNSGRISGSTTIIGFNPAPALNATSPQSGFFSSVNNLAGGQIDGIKAQVSQLTNAGLIDGVGFLDGGQSAIATIGGSDWYYFNHGSNISNLAGGVIGNDGLATTVALNSEADVLTNAGTITNSGTGFAVSTAAVVPYVFGGSTVNNAAGGLIESYGLGATVQLNGGADTLTNAGTISNNRGGSAIEATNSASYGGGITNASGGLVQNNSATVPTLALSSPRSVTNAGTISNTGGGAAVSAANGLALTNAGGVINGDIVTGGGSSTIDNSGGGQINGNITFGGSNNRLISDLGTGANPIQGVSGTISGGVNNTLQLNTTSNATLIAEPILPGVFQKLTFGIGNGATLTVDVGATLTSTVNLAALSGPTGAFVNNGTVTTTGAAIAPDGINVYNYDTSVTNNGTITATLAGGAYAISQGIYGLGSITNTGTIAAIGGGGVSADSGGAVNNSGTITSDGTGIYAFDGSVTNSGTVHSNIGVGVYLYGNVGSPATNTGLIYGQTIGAQLLGYTLTNSGTISSPGLAVSVDPYGTLINQSGGVINGNVGTSLYGFTFNAEVENAGTINGNINFGNAPFGQYSSGDSLINQTGGVINGTVTIGSGSVTNAGLINGGGDSVVFLGAVANTLTLQTGSTLVGDAVGSTQGATNTLILQGHGEADNNFLNFNTLSMQGTGAWTLGGTSTIGATRIASGALVVTGHLSSAFTIDPGATLQGSSATLEGAVTDNGTLVFDQASNGAFANAITGSGKLIKQNAGTLVLNGVSSVASTSVNGGVLAVGDSTHPDAELTSSVTVNAGGTLIGHGAIVGDIVNNGGVVAPGGSIGVLTVNGAYTQTAAGMLSLEVSPLQGSRLQVNGTATLAGSLQLVAQPGIYRKGTSYDLLNAQSINGGFSPVTATNGMQLSTAVRGVEIVATVTHGVAPLASGYTANERALANAFINYPVGVSDFDPVADAIVGISAGAQQNAAFDRLGGEVYADLLTAGRDSARTFLGGLSDQLSAEGAAGGAGQNTAVWARAFASFGSVSGDGDAHGLSNNAGGAIFGVSHRFGPGTELGVAATYGRTSLSLNGLSQSGDLDTGAAALYGEQRWGVLFVDGAVSYDYDHAQGHRTIALPGVNRTASSGFSGDTLGAMVQAGVRVERGGFRWEPSVGMVYSRVHQDGFTESGAGGADLSVGSQNLNAAESLAGLRVSRTYVVSGGALKWDGRLAWAHELGDVDPTIGESFAAASGTDFVLKGARLSTDNAVVGVGLTYERGSNLSFYARYDGQLGQRETQSAVTLGARFAW